MHHDPLFDVEVSYPRCRSCFQPEVLVVVALATVAGFQSKEACASWIFTWEQEVIFWTSILLGIDAAYMVEELTCRS